MRLLISSFNDFLSIFCCNYYFNLGHETMKKYLNIVFVLFLSFCLACSKKGKVTYLVIENNTSCDYNLFETVNQNANSPALVNIPAHQKETITLQLICKKCNQEIRTFDLQEVNCSSPYFSKSITVTLFTNTTSLYILD